MRSHTQATNLPLTPPEQIRNQPTQQQISFGTPSRIQIPKLGVDTTVEQVGMDANGNMDVPKDPDNVAWYRLGYKIGGNGSAVIAAHFDKPSGAPAVFYHLSSLQPGDAIKVSDESGNTLTYRVTESTAYPYDNFPLQKVFNSSGTPTLNLITCDGTWDRTKKTYSNRLVVFSQLEQS
jgi:sortase (surface protein transpeptidase)